MVKTRVVAPVLIGLIVASMFSFGHAVLQPNREQAEEFLGLAEQAKTYAEQLSILQKGFGVGTAVGDALIKEGDELLGNSRAALQSGDFSGAVAKARGAQAAFRDAVRTLGTPSTFEQVEQAGGLIVAIQRARLRAAEVTAVIQAYQTQATVDQQSLENIALINSNIASAETSLEQAENALKSSPPDVSSAARKLGEAQRSLAAAFSTIKKVEFRTNVWRVPGFIIALEKLIDRTQEQLRAASTRGIDVQDLQAQLGTVRDLVNEARDKSVKGDIQAALKLVKDARGILHQVDNELSARSRR